MTASKIEFDPFSPEYFADPYPIYRVLREEAPVYYSQLHDFYALSRHEDVTSAYRDHKTYSSTRGVTLDEIKAGETLHAKSIILMDPPDHRRFRGLVNKVFTPRAVQALEDVIGDRVGFHLSRVNPDRFDLVADFSSRFPVEVIATMLGVPDADSHNIMVWIEEFLHREPGQTGLTTTAGAEAMFKMAALMYDLIQQRRAEPQDDMISAIIAAEVERDDAGSTRLDDVEMTGFCVILGAGGAETVTKLLGSAAVLFSQHPDQWEQLRADRSKVPAAIEEVLRFDGPVQYNCRYALQDVQLHGTTIPAGSAVMLIGGSANHDERAFTNAEAFDINRDRTQSQHLGFGGGVHSCIGAALARLETRIAFEHLLDFMPEFSVDYDNLQRVTSPVVAGYTNVPVRVRR